MPQKKGTPNFDVERFRAFVKEFDNVALLSRTLGVSRQSVYKYLCGQTTPQEETYKKLVKIW